MGNSCGGNSYTADEIFYVPQTGFTIPVRTVRRMGWKADLPDHRDLVVVMESHRKKDLPKKVDLRPQEHFGVYDQGHLGSCTANALGAAFHFDQVKQGFVEFTPSRLFIYFNERAMEGSIDHDAGAYIRDGARSLNQIGCCAESLWPYDEGKFTNRPGDSCYTAAAKNRVKEYARISQTIEDMKAVLAAGFPFVFGFIVLSSFFKIDNSGMMTMPRSDDKVQGGHAVCAVGYDDAKQCMIVRNSWSDKWGDKGYFYMPYKYISNSQLANDFWYLQSIDGKSLPTKKMFES